MLFLKFWSIWT